MSLAHALVPLLNNEHDCQRRMSGYVSMRVVTEEGRVLDADFTVEAEPGSSLLSLVLESGSGSRASTDRVPRNPDYRPALHLLLTRLQQRGAILMEGLVDSRKTASLPEAERRLFHTPIHLAQVDDVEALRKRLGTAQSRVGQTPGAVGAGNTTRRIRLRLLVHGYGLHDASRLAADLAVPTPVPSTLESGEPDGRSIIEVPTMLVHVPQTSAALLNLEVGLETQTWGFPGHLTYPQYQYVVFGVGASPRVPLKEWLDKRATLYVCQAGTRPYIATAPHMPDEVAEGTVKWLTRIGIEPLGVLEDVPLGSNGPLSPEASDALRRSGTHRGYGRMATTDVSRLFEWMGLPLTPDSEGVPRPPLNQTAPVMVAPKAHRQTSRAGSGAGRQMDPAKRIAVEQHAVELARQHYGKQGWEIEELGKPFDLRLTKPGSERRVEVKGTTGSPTSVELTANEVRHAREFPTMDLFVVSDITVTGTSPQFATSGGTITLLTDWHPEDTDLRATKFEYRLPS